MARRGSCPSSAGCGRARGPRSRAALDLAGPDPAWAATGRRLAARVRARGRRRGACGSTTSGRRRCPGLVAKDVVDLQLVVTDLAAADAVADRLGAAGFPRREGGWTDTPKPGEAGRRGTSGCTAAPTPAGPVNLHVRAAGSPGARYALLFRDWLRAEPGERDGYAALKTPPRRRRTGAARDYAEAKEPWFTDVAWPRMQAWAARTGWVSPV